MATRPPDYRLKILNKSTDSKCPNAGAAWINENGSITITINPGVRLIENRDLLYTLFPYEYNKMEDK